MEDEQVLLLDLEVKELQDLDNDFTLLGVESIIILRVDVDGKLLLLSNDVLGDSVEILNCNSSLGLVVMDIENLILADDENSILSPLIFIDFLNFIREKNLLVAKGLHEFLVTLDFAIIVID